ncbi:acyl-CoA thioesterase [Sphingobacterium faecium]|jgi:enediyne biosynthesis thioesterase|uniref:acyl-CoA thioesterase n=1 Tax=Sphingobacterium faecium TaxID=34087 RepID=UPI00320B0D21
MAMIYSSSRSYYEYRFISTFEETNVVGNIYFANYVVWQGKCREHFLYEYCPDIIKEINNGLALITLDLSMEYISQLFAFDHVVMRMYLEGNSSSRLLMSFEYFKINSENDWELIAKGTQSTLAMREKDGKLSPCEFPNSLFRVFEEYNLN